MVDLQSVITDAHSYPDLLAHSVVCHLDSSVDLLWLAEMHITLMKYNYNIFIPILLNICYSLTKVA